MIRNIGLYCGTFNPFHKGHLNVYQKAQQIFEEVIVARGMNPDKLKGEALPFSPPKGILVHPYTTLTTNVIQSYNERGYNTTLIRGIRNGYDYDYEINQINVMRDLFPDLQVILIPCDREFAHISSTMIRNLQVFDKEAANKYLP